jgi:serine protease Do
MKSIERPVFRKLISVLGCGLMAVCLPALGAIEPEPQLAAPPAPPAPPAPMIAQGMIVSGGSYLGVGVREIDEDRAKTLRLRETYGVEITRVDDDSPAFKAGLKAGDVVLEYNATRVEGIEQFVRLVRETPANRNVKLTVSREGSIQTIAATVGARKGPKVMTWTSPNAPNMDKFKVEIPRMEMYMPDIPKTLMSWRSTMLGVEAEALGNSQLADYFGAKEGVLIRSVMKGTAAEKAGIKAGDVLLKIDDSAVTSPKDITNTLRSARSSSKKNLSVVLMRERREMSLTVTLDDEPEAPQPRSQKVTQQRF